MASSTSVVKHLEEKIRVTPKVVVDAVASSVKDKTNQDAKTENFPGKEGSKEQTILNVDIPQQTPALPAETHSPVKQEKQEFTVPLFEKRKIEQVSDDSDNDSTVDALSMFFSPAEYAHLCAFSNEDSVSYLEEKYGDEDIVQHLLDNVESSCPAIYLKTLNELLYFSIG